MLAMLKALRMVNYCCGMPTTEHDGGRNGLGYGDYEDGERINKKC
jgi:hypothetical protein